MEIKHLPNCRDSFRAALPDVQHRTPSRDRKWIEIIPERSFEVLVVEAP